MGRGDENLKILFDRRKGEGKGLLGIEEDGWESKRKFDLARENSVIFWMKYVRYLEKKRGRRERKEHFWRSFGEVSEKVILANWQLEREKWWGSISELYFLPDPVSFSLFCLLELTHLSLSLSLWSSHSLSSLLLHPFFSPSPTLSFSLICSHPDLQIRRRTI